MNTTVTIPAALSKAAEVSILRQLSAAIGPQSYIGPWLADVAHAVEADIASDLPPAPTPAQAREMQHEALQALNAAHTQAERITAAAYAQAKQIRAAARQSADAITARAASQVRAALRDLES
jgi:F0F1-type ATP synthase membrane subunit b/b'